MLDISSSETLKRSILALKHLMSPSFTMVENLFPHGKMYSIFGLFLWSLEVNFARHLVGFHLLVC